MNTETALMLVRQALDPLIVAYESSPDTSVQGVPAPEHARQLRSALSNITVLEQAAQSLGSDLASVTRMVAEWLAETYNTADEAEDAGICQLFQSKLRDLCERFCVDYPWGIDIEPIRYEVENCASNLEDIANTAAALEAGISDIRSTLEDYEDSLDPDVLEVLRTRLADAEVLRDDIVILVESMDFDEIASMTMR